MHRSSLVYLKYQSPECKLIFLALVNRFGSSHSLELFGDNIVQYSNRQFCSSENFMKLFATHHRCLLPAVYSSDIVLPAAACVFHKSRCQSG